MKKRKVLLASLAIAMLGTIQTVTAQVKHIILISIDGFHPDMYLDKSWPAPNLRELMKNGTYADHMKGVFPSFTYPSHTAMITGALPARSGIIFNQPIGSKGEWYWYTKSIKVPTLWQALKQNGMTTATVLWPVTVGGDITWNVPDVWRISNPADRATATKQYATPGLMKELEENATGKIDSLNYNEDYLTMDGQSGRMAAYIFKTKLPNLMAIHFTGCDDMEHEYGRDADSVRIALASVDHAIGEILEAVNRSSAKASTAVIIVGDHGFATIHTIFRPNMLIKNVPAKFIASGGSCFLYGAPTAVQAVRDSLGELPKDKQQLFRIVDRQELDRMGADPAALMALAAVPGTVFSGAVAAGKVSNKGAGTLIQNNPLDGIFIPTKGGHHGYDPDLPEMYTGFIAAGAGIKKGGHIASLSEPDIAPLIAKLLSIAFKAPDGQLVPGIQASAQGIRFEQNQSWEQLQAKARATHQYIFVDCFASWCGPCKLMDKEVYNNDTVGNEFNAHFISVKMQLDTSRADNQQVKDRYADAHHILYDYQIKAFPTFLFFSPEGKLVHRSVGYEPAADFVQIAKDVRNPGTQYYTLLDHFNKGQRIPAEMRLLALEAKAIDEQSVANQVAAEQTGYLLRQNEQALYTRENISFIGSFTQNSKDPGFDIFIRHAVQADAAMGVKNYSRDIIDKVLILEEVNPVLKKVPVNWKLAENTIAVKYDAVTADRVVTKAKIFTGYGKDWPAFTAAIVRYTERYEDKDNLALLDKNAGYVLKYSKDQQELAAALAWSKQTLAKAPQNKTYQQTCRALQAKLNTL